MTSLTDPRRDCSPIGQPEGSAFPVTAPLDPFVHRDSRWCADCGGPQLFVEVFECEAGRVGVCMGCGEERVIRFTRTNSEAV